MRFVLALLASLTLAACHQPVQTQAKFNPEEAAFIKKDGPGAISGHAFLKRKNGRNVYASGEIVRLTPVTAYSSERFARLYGGGKFVSAAAMPKVDADPVYASYTRTTKTDHMGRFRFEKVAPGRYFVSTQVVWRDQGEYFPQGGAMFEVAEVGGKEERPVDVILSGN